MAQQESGIQAIGQDADTGFSTKDTGRRVRFKGVMFMTKVMFSIFLLVFCSSAFGADIPEKVFVETAKKYMEAFNAVDFAKVRTLWSPELLEQVAEEKKEPKEEFEQLVQLVMQHLGKMTKIELAELDPPDGAFFTAYFERGKAELFFVLNEKYLATEINLRVIGHSDCSEEEEPQAKDASD
jgi:hypothetical protein